MIGLTVDKLNYNAQRNSRDLNFFKVMGKSLKVPIHLIIITSTQNGSLIGASKNRGAGQ
jgi:hypothetical protein